MEQGIIYILANKNGQIVKVGETKGNPKHRERDYIKEYDLKDFSLFKTFKVPVLARKEIEKIAHQKLKTHQVSGIAGARELFNCSKGIAENAILQAINESELNRREVEKQKQLDIDLARKQKLKKIEDERAYKEIKKREVEWERCSEKLELDEKITQTLVQFPIEYEKPLSTSWWIGTTVILGLGLGLGVAYLFGGWYALGDFGSTKANYWPVFIPGFPILWYFFFCTKNGNFYEEKKLVPHKENTDKLDALKSELHQKKEKFLENRLN